MGQVFVHKAFWSFRGKQSLTGFAVKPSTVEVKVGVCCAQQATSNHKQKDPQLMMVDFIRYWNALTSVM